jgi:hypothetical protein
MPESEPAAGYAAAAEIYWQQGWRGILPLRRGFKKTPPTGFTGKAGIYPSFADITAWGELYPDGNVCLRMPEDIIGIDVDAYGAKTGAAALQEAEKRWGKLPPTLRSTSREDGVSGIRFYRVPAGAYAEGIEFPDLGVGDIEICQRGHRYVIVWPSIHPEGRPYWWLNDNLQFVSIPSIDDIPALPAAWVENLAAHNKSDVHLDGAVYQTRDALTGGESSQAVVHRLRLAIKELNLPGQSRHDTCRGHVLALLRMGKLGEPGVKPALAALGEMFIALVAKDRPGGKDEAVCEYKSMVTGVGAARELAKPGITDWILKLDTQAAVVIEPEPPQPARPHIEEIERGFWTARESLAGIYTTALARMCSPWAVFGYTVARVLTQIPPHIMLPPVIGGPGSLNWFAAIAAFSGGGKGSASAAARLLVPTHVESRNLGSGEGIIAAYGHQGDPTSFDAIMFTADEIDTMTAMSTRQGSTTMSVLRSAFSGEGLGFSYVSKDKRYRLAAQEYRFTLVASVQPERAEGLLGDAAGGTPQRFMWFPGVDHRITAKVPWETGPLNLPKPTEWMYPATLKIPVEAEQFIRQERVKTMQGKSDALDGHAIFCREKLAFALAVIDGRTEMALDDWELSGIAADISTWTRLGILDTLRSAGDRDDEERGRRLGVANEAADFERVHRRGERTGRVLRWLLRKLDEAGAEGLTKRELNQKVAGRDKSLLEAALMVAVTEELIHLHDGRWVKR